VNADGRREGDVTDVMRIIGTECAWLALWGSRRFETRDASTNNWWVALLSFGDGWHNNHHAYPVSARHGLKWYEIDFNWYGIWVLKKLGLASHVYRATLPTHHTQFSVQTIRR
jgi:fatty-acid desaturase